MAESQFEKGHQIPPHNQERPGKQKDMQDPKPVSTQLPTEDGDYQKYKAAGKLEGKKAIITGGDSGIGRAIAILFAMEGADSLIVELPDEEEDAQETKKRVEEHGRKCYLLATDIKEKENCKKIIDTALDKLGGVNILVNNAGTQIQVEKIKDLTEHTWEDTFATNINPVFYLSKYVLPHLKSGDTIINNASINAYVGRPDLLDYTSTKGAIVSFTRALSNQVAGEGIRVNCVCPGPVWTPLIPATMTKETQKGFHQTPMGRAGQPSEVATCFVFLASQDSSFISGQSLHPNGGVVVNG
ncbi:NAD(P)-binding protein [Eremomyces bilateralis CBS 781.70]|uniref:NAD(P)-binding protein n=1 Tax=Eremomyces bilateralis CBS 781.70 TaxID=1392243 RepID=A0A6G1FVY2_9PEZI|nr:NAD(P)-binding protein [Eremomyces bilateralis CBS 781.70]KAF1810065.1 NAD(P)-binding protein [Eremomyces bilateralis CBS 781.70]